VLPGRGQDADPAFFAPFADFVREHPALEPLAYTFRPLWVGCGYTYYETIPALYIIKFLHQLLSLPASLEMASVVLEPRLRRMTPLGLQEIWARLAADLPDVRLGHRVRRVQRPETGPIVIESSAPNGAACREEYDRLFISTDPGLALDSYLADPSPEETELFARVRTVDFHVSVSKVNGLPADKYPDGFEALLDSMTQDREGYPVYAIKTAGDPSHLVAGQVAPPGADEANLFAKLQDGIEVGVVESNLSARDRQQSLEKPLSLCMNRVI
jgi:hypothetical protein